MNNKEEFEPISSEEDLITPERLAKGDLKISKNAKDKIREASQIDLYIISKLISNNILEAHHEVYGIGFLELRAAFRAPSAAKCSAVLLEQWGTGVSMSKATEIYQNVCRGMRGRGIEVIQYALEEVWHENFKFNNGLFQEHFERLVNLMDEERERIYREEERKLGKI